MQQQHAAGALSRDDGRGEDEDEELGALVRSHTAGGGTGGSGSGSRRGQQKNHQRATLRARSLSATLGDLFTRGSGGGGGGGNGNGRNDA